MASSPTYHGLSAFQLPRFCGSCLSQGPRRERNRRPLSSQRLYPELSWFLQHCHLRVCWVGYCCRPVPSVLKSEFKKSLFLANVTAASTPTPLGRCDRFEFECHQPKKCIPNWKRCDGHRDCRDGQDEASCRESWRVVPREDLWEHGVPLPVLHWSEWFCNFGIMSILEIGILSFKEYVISNTLVYLFRVFFVTSWYLFLMLCCKFL